MQGVHCLRQGVCRQCLCAHQQPIGGDHRRGCDAQPLSGHLALSSSLHVSPYPLCTLGSIRTTAQQQQQSMAVHRAYLCIYLTRRATFDRPHWTLATEGRWFSFLLVFFGFLRFSFGFLLVFFWFSFGFLLVFFRFSSGFLPVFLKFQT